MKTYLIYNINWDTDGQRVRLPKKLKITVTDDFNCCLDGADYLSDKFGWCVFGFDFKEVTR
jgi:hypothetical protein